MSKAVIFDLDDTLYPERDFVRGGLLAAGKLLDQILQSQNPKTGGTTPTGPLFIEIMEREGVSKVFDKGLESLGLSADPTLIRRLVEAYRSHDPFIAPYPGAVELLEDLKKRGVVLGLLTDGPLEVQQRKVQALGIKGFFDVIVYTDALGKRPKPHLRGFLHVERSIGLRGSSILMVGDRPKEDLVPASILGWRTIRIRNPHGFHIHDADPDECREVADGIEGLRALLAKVIEGLD